MAQLVGWTSDTASAAIEDMRVDHCSPNVLMPKEFLHRAYVVTVVDEHPVPSVPTTGYSVEFFDMTDNTVAVVTIPASNLRVLTPADRPSVRVLSGAAS